MGLMAFSETASWELLDDARFFGRVLEKKLKMACCGFVLLLLPTLLI